MPLQPCNTRKGVLLFHLRKLLITVQFSLEASLLFLLRVYHQAVICTGSATEFTPRWDAGIFTNEIVIRTVPYTYLRH